MKLLKIVLFLFIYIHVQSQELAIEQSIEQSYEFAPSQNESYVSEVNYDNIELDLKETQTFPLPPIFVLNLDRSTERWAEAQVEMKKAGLDDIAVRLPAVDGRELSRADLLKVSTKIATFLQPRGVIGCYLSHRKFWQLVVDNQYESAIVFEDDVQLVPNFKEILTNNLIDVVEKNTTFDVLLLGAIGRVHPQGHDGLGVRVFSMYIGGNRPLKQISNTIIQPARPAGTHAYIVSYEGAKKLLSLCDKATFHVDLDAWRHRSLTIRMFDPMLAYQTFESTSLTELNERTSKGPRKFINDLITHTKFYNKVTEWAVEPYTHQPWSHVMDEPLLQFGPNGVVLTVKRHLAIVTTGASLAACLQLLGLTKQAKYVIGTLSAFLVGVRSIIWILMNWR